MSVIALDRGIYLERLGDPSTWSGDWRRSGKYLSKEQQTETRSRLAQNEALMVGMMVRRQPSTVIAAVLLVSREAIDSRRRPLGLCLQRGAGTHAGR
jgi:hypothetical protein